MTLEQAVEVLNREGHGGHDDWESLGGWAQCGLGFAYANRLTTFEAIREAEAYERTDAG